MGRGVEQSARWPRLHFLPGIHDQHPIRGIGDHGEIVRDQDERHVTLLLQVRKQVQDLLLNGHVQRCGGFVGDQQPGIAGNCHCNHHPLVHPAREQMGEGGDALFRTRNADLAEQFDAARPCRGARQAEMHPQGLADLPANGEARVEAGHRLLEDHRDVFADELPSGAGRQRQQVDTVETKHVRLHLAGAANQPHHGQHGDGLAGAGFADNAQHLTR